MVAGFGAEIPFTAGFFVGSCPGVAGGFCPLASLEFAPDTAFEVPGFPELLPAVVPGLAAVVDGWPATFVPEFAAAPVVALLASAGGLGGTEGSRSAKMSAARMRGTSVATG